MYQSLIRNEMTRQGFRGVDPRHVEAYMRLGFSTLDGLSREAFSREVRVGVICTQEDGTDNAEKLAKLTGFEP